ncbi:MAG: hypothetical protein A2Z34_06615, partial [Planctomycetes bacterium RBG_16_59_8]
MAYCHERGKKLYVTLNNLQTAEELEEIDDYLRFLSEIRPDAVILQDLGLLRRIRELGLKLDIHVSTMLNTHNAPTLALLARHGVTRVVLSKDIALKDVHRLRTETAATGIELEYFVHGDTCIAHHGSCAQSGVVLGASSNKGRCYKSCRWDYELVDGATGKRVASFNDGPYVLAHNDLCLLSHIPEVVRAGIATLKIEGRMRPAEYVAPIVAVYRRAVDRYAEDPSGYLFNIEDLRSTVEDRVRDLTTGSAFHQVRLESVGSSGEREPKIFSKPVKEKRLDFDDILTGSFERCFTVETILRNPSSPRFSVHVGDMASALAAMTAGADAIFIGGTVSLARAIPWSLEQIKRCIAEGRRRGVKVFVATPSYLLWRELEECREMVRALADSPPDGWLLPDMGAISLMREEGRGALIGDFSLNVMNRSAAEFLAGEGLELVALSPELSFRQATEAAHGSSVKTEVLVHGAVAGMRLDHCLIAALAGNRTSDDVCPAPCRGRGYGLRDGAGEVHSIEPDQYCRNTLLIGADLCVLPFVRSFAAAGFASLRYEAQYDPPEHVGKVVDLYRRAIDDPSFALDRDGWESLCASAPRPLNL